MDIITCSPQLSGSAMPETFANLHVAACTTEVKRSWRDLDQAATRGTSQGDIAVHSGGYDVTFDQFPITMGSPPPRLPV